MGAFTAAQTVGLVLVFLTGAVWGAALAWITSERREEKLKLALQRQKLLLRLMAVEYKRSANDMVQPNNGSTDRVVDLVVRRKD